MPEFTEKEKFNASTAADLIKIELEVNLDQMERIEKLTGGDKQVMTVLQQAISTLNSLKSISELLNVISSAVGALKNINSNYAPKIMTKLFRAKKYIEQLFAGKDVVYAKNLRQAIKKIFAEENLDEAHPELDKYQSMPVSPSEGENSTNIADIEDDREMALENPPESPENTNMLSSKVEQALSLLNEAKDLFRPDDFFVKRPRRKDRILSRLVKEILRARKSAELILKLLNRNLRQKP